MFGFDDLFAVGSKLLGGFLDNQAASDRQSDAQAFSAQQYATRYQTQVADMKAAGLNPMLAYTQAPGNSPGGVVSTPGSQYSGVADTILQSKMNSAQVANIMADTENKKASADLIEAQAENQRASAAQARSSVGQIEATVDKIREEIKNIPDEGRRLRAVYHNLAEHSALMAQQGESEVSRRKNLEALTAKLLAEGAITRSELKAIEDTGGVGRIARELKPISDIGADWLSPGKWFKNRSETTSNSTVTHKR